MLPLEILEDLLSNQPLVVEIVESCQRQTEAGLAQETLLKCLGIFPILQAQRIEGARRCLTAGGDHLAEQLSDPLAEQRVEPALDKPCKFLERQPADQQCLETDRDLTLQRSGKI